MPLGRSFTDSTSVDGGGANIPFGDFDEDEDIVSRESVPCSELGAKGGTGGMISAGARKPFFVVADEREPEKNKPFAFGAEATRRMNLEAEAPIALGLKGSPVRERDGVGGGTWEGGGDDGWGVWFVVALPRGEPVLFENAILCLSVLACGRGFPRGLNGESTSVDWGKRLV